MTCVNDFKVGNKVIVQYKTRSIPGVVIKVTDRWILVRSYDRPKRSYDDSILPALELTKIDADEYHRVTLK